MKLAKAKELIAAARKSAAGRIAKREAAAQMRPVYCYAIGAGLGAMDARGIALPNPLGAVVPSLATYANPKAQMAALAAFAADKSSGKVKEVLGDVAASLASIGGYEMGRGLKV
jgi:hypothetical protein